MGVVFEHIYRAHLRAPFGFVWQLSPCGIKFSLYPDRFAAQLLQNGGG